MKVVIGVTGASGTIYAIRLIERLEGELSLIVSENGKKIMKFENNLDPSVFSNRLKIYEDYDLFAPIASGSYVFDAMIIVPASMNTVAKIASGISDTLITRVAFVALKERRKLILVPRETPLSSIALENMKKLSDLGAIILPACPGFYLKPKTIEDLVDFIVNRILDELGIRGDYPRWGKNTS
ncbi:MAG: UbiX family flavin prenyltransferase [Thermoplasmata archaeon]|jgi:4-hydroxy-3-polyprenylbenzoate decarboxylase|nr:UbiX family flavin prenyltransferase [Euryarchaeota archaeon]